MSSHRTSSLLQTASMRFSIILLLIAMSGADAPAIGRVYARRPNNPNSEIYNLRIKQLSATVEIRDQLAVTHVDQEFTNTTWYRLEGFYVFQLPEGAEVHEMYLWINGIRTPYVVKEREEAVERYTEIVTRTADPAILEELGSNKFQLRIFPFDPHGTRRIEIVYTQPLPYFKGSIQYTFPLDMTDYTSDPIENVTLSVDIRTQTPVVGVSTSVDQYPTAAEVTKVDNMHYTVTYGVENVSFARDFFVRAQYSGQAPAMRVLTSGPVGATTEDPFYLLWITTPDSLVGDTTRPRQITFVADVSSSMEGLRISQLKDALRSFVDLLSERDAFNIILFSTGVSSFRPDVVKATLSARDSARAFISTLNALGLTNIEAALETALQQSTSVGASASVIFFTDGHPTWGEVNVDSILARAERWNPQGVPVFTVGVGEETDYDLIARLAASTDAMFTPIAAEDSILLKVKDLFRKIALPPLKDTHVEYATLDAFDIHPMKLPVMYAGDQVLLCGRYTAGGTHTVAFKGVVDGSPFALSQSLTFPAGPAYDAAIERFWGACKVRSLLGLIQSNGEQQELVDQVIALSIRYSVLTPYTAFLVVEPTEGTTPLPVRDVTPVPHDLRLLQNFPNPFNPSTTIRYLVPSEAFITVEIVDVLGRRVALLMSRTETPGEYEVVWNGTDDDGLAVPSGVYYCRLVTESTTAVIALLLMK